MEVVNLDNNNEFVSTKVFVIDKMGNIYKNGDVFKDIRHRVFLLEVANTLYPFNEFSKHLDSKDVSPYNIALIFNMLGFTVILNSPTRNDEFSTDSPKYLMILENHEATPEQRQSIKYCLAHFEGYCVDFCAKNLLDFNQFSSDAFSTITKSGIPTISPLSAYEKHLEEAKNNSTRRLYK